MILNRDFSIYRDIAISALIGPLRLLFPTIGTLVTYRLVLRYSGLEVLGLWSIISTVFAYISVVDIGFSQVLAREVADTRSLTAMDNGLWDKEAAEWGYNLVLWGGALPCALLIGYFVTTIPYSRIGFTVALVLVAFASVEQLKSKLDMAILSASQENAYIQFVGSLAAVVSIFVSIFGTVLSYPIEGFALSALIGAGLTRWAFRRRLAQRGLDRVSAPCNIAKMDRLRALSFRGRVLYTVSIGMVLREPVFRLVIAGFLGVRDLGVYTIALRLAGAARELIAGGFGALYPAFALLHRNKDQRQIAETISTSMIALAIFGGCALAVLYSFAQPIIGIWLGEIPTGAVSATRILIVWNLITLFNIPFFYLLQASGHERAASLSLWLHTSAILCLIPMHLFLSLDIHQLLLYWTGTAIATQIAIYYYVEVKLGLFKPIAINPDVLKAVVLLAIFLGGIAFADSVVTLPEQPLHQFSAIFKVVGPLSVGFVLLATFLTRKSLLRFWRAAE